MNLNPLTADLFLCGVYEYREEAFDMQALLNGNDLEGGVSPNPTFPNVVSLDLIKPLHELGMYTNNLRDLAAPRELCVKKALELISNRSTYDLNVAAFRMELLTDVLAEIGEDDVDALVKGICCICDFLMANFDNYTQSSAQFFSYEFYSLHHDRYLFMSKIILDANIPAIRPATIIQPAYTYPEVQARNRAHYIAQADQCVVF